MTLNPFIAAFSGLITLLHFNASLAASPDISMHDIGGRGLTGPTVRLQA